MGHEEDRERKFEQALTRHLREDAGAHEALNRGTENAAEACPDAEMLAAFHERMLSSEEMNSVKEHVASCIRCQEILAHLEASDEVGPQLEEENVLEMREPVLAGGADHEEQFPRAAVPAVATATLTSPRDISSGRGARMWRWVAPAGAIAAGLLIWAVVRDKPHEFAPAGNVQIAQQQTDREQADREQAVAQAREAANNLRSDSADEISPTENRQARLKEKSAARNSPAEMQSQLADRLSKDGRSARGAAGGLAAGRLSTEEQRNINKNLRRAEPAASPKSMAKPSASPGAPAAPSPAGGATAHADKQISDLPIMARNEAILSPEKSEAKKAPARERDTLNKEKIGPGVAASSPAPGAPPTAMSEGITVQAGPAPPPKPEQKMDADSKADGGSATTAQAQVTAGYARTSTALKGKVTEDSKIILTPGGTALWRLRGAGIIERSVDRGLTWSRQESGTTRDLVTGSAPSDVVCWIVGRRGVILRTVDGGGHWEKVAAPVARDFAGIRATDALHATILDSAGRAKFVTSDGGVNWEPLKE